MVDKNQSINEILDLETAIQKTKPEHQENLWPVPPGSSSIENDLFTPCYNALHIIYDAIDMFKVSLSFVFKEFAYIATFNRPTGKF